MRNVCRMTLGERIFVMVKSVFGKYLSAFIAIILVFFALLLLIMMGVLNQYATSMKEQSVVQTANSLAQYVKNEMREKETREEQYAVLNGGNINHLVGAIDLALSGADDVTIVLTDAKGALVATGGENHARISRELVLSDRMLYMLRYTYPIGEISYFQELFENVRVGYAVPVLASDGSFAGAVVVLSSSAEWSGLLDMMTKTIIMGSLWIMLAALIAVYFISERVTAPLKDMSRAVKDFAAGRFDSRVIVHGDDEIAQLGIAFNQMASSLQNLDTVRNTFLSNVSHDLRTPMTTIAGFIDSIRDGIIPYEKQGHYLDIVSSEVHRLSRLVASLLDLSRIQAGDRKFVIKPFDICEMARQILISSEQRLVEKDLQVEFLCDEDKMLVMADHDAIYQILYNLCDNAIKFSSEGGTYRITITERTDIKNKIQVSVYNSGQGIAQSDIPFVFERFYKGDKSRGLDKKGAGLGLYIAKTIIAAHNEEIWVTSEYGKDCQFNFTLTKQMHVPTILYKNDEM